MEICLVQISFDGNCSWNPPSLMDDNTFKSLKNSFKLNFASYTNVIYEDAFQFTFCDINWSAATEISKYYN